VVLLSICSFNHEHSELQFVSKHRNDHGYPTDTVGTFLHGPTYRYFHSDHHSSPSSVVLSCLALRRMATHLDGPSRPPTSYLLPSVSALARLLALASRNRDSKPQAVKLHTPPHHKSRARRHLCIPCMQSAIDSTVGPPAAWLLAWPWWWIGPDATKRADMDLCSRLVPRRHSPLPPLLVHPYSKSKRPTARTC
jgi:hypothetical protein